MATEELKHYLQDLYYDRKRMNYDELTVDEKAKLTGLFMLDMNDSERMDFICETKLSDKVTRSLAKFLISHDESTEDFIKKRDSLIKDITVGALLYSLNMKDELFEQI